MPLSPYLTFIAELPLAVCLKSIHTNKVIVWNPQCEEQLNIPNQMALGKSFSEFLDQDFSKRSEMIETRLSEKKHGSEISEDCIKLKGKGHQWFKIHHMIIQNEQLKDHILIVFENITDKKRSERELSLRLKIMEASEKSRAETEKTLLEVSKLTHVGYWELSTTFPDQLANFSLETFKILGYEAESTSATYNWFLEHIHSEDKSSFELALHLLETEKTEQCDITIRLMNKCNEVVFVHILGSKAVNRPGVYQGSIQDITRLKVAEAEKARMQEQLVQASKMASLGEMARGMAHEINNPLAIISGHAHLMEIQLSKEPVSLVALKETAEHIKIMVKRISTIIEGLRNFARAGTQEVFTKVSLNSIIEETLNHLYERFKNHNIPIKLESIPNDLTVYGKKGQLSQILLQLLNNAYDAITTSQERWIEIKVSSTEKMVVISVIDSGPGIPPNLREKILTPFFSTKAVGTSTGLGLSIAYGLVQDHGGELKLDSNYPHTKFDVSLPKS